MTDLVFFKTYLYRHLMQLDFGLSPLHSQVFPGFDIV